MTSALGALLAFLLVAGPARAEWLQPDPSYREAQMLLRAAARDTLNHGDDAARLDSLGIALLRLAQTDACEPIFKRVLTIAPDDPAALGGLGKVALFKNRLTEAEPLLEHASRDDEAALPDLFATLVRLGRYAAAADMAETVNATGRAEMLRRMAAGDMYQMSESAPEISVRWKRAYPLPLVPVDLNGRRVLMAVDTGASDLLIDDSAARLTEVQTMAADAAVFWSGSRTVVRNAVVQTLKIGDLEIRNVPAGVLSLRKWSLVVNPRGERVAGVIGINLLHHFTPTLDFPRHRLILRREGAAFTPGPNARRVPFEIWGENEITVRGTLAGGRKMAMVVQTGLPGCGVGAPREVFEEIGVKPGTVAKLVKGAGQWLQGVPWEPVTVSTVSVGPIIEDKVQGWQNALASSELWRHGARRDAVLSNDFFMDYRLTIDWAKLELVFEEK